MCVLLVSYNATCVLNLMLLDLVIVHEIALVRLPYPAVPPILHHPSRLPSLPSYPVVPGIHTG